MWPLSRYVALWVGGLDSWGIVDVVCVEASNLAMLYCASSPAKCILDIYLSKDLDQDAMKCVFVASASLPVTET